MGYATRKVMDLILCLLRPAACVDPVAHQSTCSGSVSRFAKGRVCVC